MLLENWPPFNSLQDSCFSCCPKANLFPYAALVRWEQQRLRNTSMIEAKEAAIAVPQRASRRSPDPGVRNLIHEAEGDSVGYTQHISNGHIKTQKVLPSYHELRNSDDLNILMALERLLR